MTTTNRRQDAQSFALSAKQFKAKLTGVKTSAANLKNGLHTILMAALVESSALPDVGHKNGARFLQIVQADLGGIRKSDVRDWVSAHSNARLTFKVEKGVETWGVKLLPPGHPEYREVTDETVAHANVNPFWQIAEKKDNADLSFDGKAFHAALARLLKKADAAATEGKLNLSPVEQARLNAIRDMVSAGKPAASTQVANAA